MDFSPPFFSSLKQSILEGRISFYHEGTDICIAIIWLIILTVQGLYVLLFKDKIQHKE